MLRRIFSYMKEYKKYAWLALICIGVEVVLEIMVPKLMADLIDIGVTNSDVPYIINKGERSQCCQNNRKLFKLDIVHSFECTYFVKTADKWKHK